VTLRLLFLLKLDNFCSFYVKLLWKQAFKVTAHLFRIALIVTSTVSVSSCFPCLQSFVVSHF
jgi:hypothetical protein